MEKKPIASHSLAATDAIQLGEPDHQPEIGDDMTHVEVDAEFEIGRNPGQ